MGRPWYIGVYGGVLIGTGVLFFFNIPIGVGAKDSMLLESSIANSVISIMASFFFYTG
jgi:hypothetical protein